MSKNDILSKLPLKAPSVHCVGIGGIGVSAIAELLLDCGCAVSGSDADYNSNCAHLAELGAVIGVAGHREENLPGHELGGAIMTAAADWQNPEIQALLRDGVMVWKRGEFLGELCRAYRRGIMVAGSHGKSTVSAMLGWIFRQCGVDAGLLLGAHYQDNSCNACAGDGDVIIAEADESDNSIKYLSGELALITNIDGDHAWNENALQEQYAAFRIFSKSFKKVIFIDSENCRSVLSKSDNAEGLAGERLTALLAMVPPRFLGYERINAALALAGAEYFKLDMTAAVKALAAYPGLQRRQNELFNCGRWLLLEDYAHHPAELAASLEVIKERYSNYHITVLFQPHRYPRLRKYFREFTAILSDKSLNVKVLPVFSAWEIPPIDALDNIELAAAICKAGGNAGVMDMLPGSAQKLVGSIRQRSGKQLAVLIGAGDLNDLIPELTAAMQSAADDEMEG